MYIWMYAICFVADKMGSFLSKFQLNSKHTRNSNQMNELWTSAAVHPNSICCARDMLPLDVVCSHSQSVPLLLSVERKKFQFHRLKVSPAMIYRKGKQRMSQKKFTDEWWWSIENDVDNNYNINKLDDINGRNLIACSLQPHYAFDCITSSY